MAVHITLVKGDGAPPIHRQIVNSVRHAISSGRLEAGERLPPVREMARELGVAMNTVARAYRELDQEGLTDNEAGRGTFVRQLMVPQVHHWAAESSATEMLRPTLTALVAMGFNRSEISAVVARLLSESPLKLGVVASTARGADKWARALREELGDFWIETIAVPLEDLTARPETVFRNLEGASFVFTLLTGYHLAREVFEGSNKQVVPLITRLSHASQQELLAIPADARLGLVCEDVYVNSVLEVVATYANNTNVERVRSDDIEGIRRLAAGCELLLYTFAAGEVIEKLPTPKATLLPLVYALSEDNLAHIRGLIAPHAPPRPASSPPHANRHGS